jgi:hypothetical protein
MRAMKTKIKKKNAARKENCGSAPVYSMQQRQHAILKSKAPKTPHYFLEQRASGATRWDAINRARMKLEPPPKKNERKVWEKVF